MTGISMESLDAVAWDGFEAALPQHPISGLPRALRRIAQAGAAAKEEDVSTLYFCLAPENGRVIPAATAAPLLERWEAETDQTVRLAVLLELGAAAAAEAAGGAGAAAGGGARAVERVRGVERVRAVLAGVLRDGGPVMKAAAVCSWARLDPRVPPERAELLLEVLSDAATRPEFEAAWYEPGVEEAFSREDVVRRAVGLLGQDPEAALSFVARPADAADRTDTELRRAVLDHAWRLLVLRPSVAPVVLPLAGAMLGDPDDAVRLKAAHLLAVLGPRAAAYADRLAALIDDPGEDAFDYTEGTVGAYARWALARIGDPRGLPGLVERLYEPYREEYGRGYVLGDPRLPEIHEVLMPLRPHADVLLPALREVMRHHAAHNDGHGPLTPQFLDTLEAWGPDDAVAALPEVLALRDDARSADRAAEVLAAMGPAASSAEPAPRGPTVPDPSADRVRRTMEESEGRYRIRAAIALWSITGEPEPSASVLEEFVLPMADGDDSYGAFVAALRGLSRIGGVTPSARSALLEVRGFDRRLSTYGDYRAFLHDEELRAVIEDVLALP
ncbi:hypothetical protein ACWGDE_13260 [Streptomyces sp. NPDC054956]